MSQKFRAAKAGNMIAAAFLPIEASAQSAAEHGAECLSVMLEQRKKVGVPLNTGDDVLVLVAESLVDILNGCQKLGSAHRGLAELAREYEVSVGDGGCPENGPRGQLIPLHRVA